MKVGITLLEVLLVVVIVSIMASLSVPSLSVLINNSRLKFQADEISGLVFKTKLKAMEDSAKWIVKFDTANRSYYAFCDTNGNGKNDEEERIEGPYKLSGGIDFGSHSSKGPNNTNVNEDGISLENNQLDIKEMGTSNAGTVYIRNSKTGVAIRMLPLSSSPEIWFWKNAWIEPK